ncbi:peptide chain release factor N(5)-glutamine methyltransferase [Candidatus Nomurabacteria bacterium]|nr:peptide chain release factor N(5)-glutamine methyltransferase [Candidatus Nomurabacteria bacterium]
MSVTNAFIELAQSLGAIYPPQEARTIARYIFEDVFDCRHPDTTEKILSDEQWAQYQDIQRRLLAHEPWQYIVGYADFYGRKFQVTPDTLIPRPETEELVRHVLSDIQDGDRILDIGTGSGCIATTLKLANPSLDITALDNSEQALALARDNAIQLGADICWMHDSILNPSKNLLEKRFERIVSNPPYIPQHEALSLDQNVAQYEPQGALFVPDTDPLLFYRVIAEAGLMILVPGGVVWLEIHQAYGQDIVDMFISYGYRDVACFQDLFKNDRFVRAYRQS